jgi:hypothetical protein
MPLNPDDWSVHARSTRDLADRMLVRGDTAGAEAMLKAVEEIEKRLKAAITIISVFSSGGDAVVSSNDPRSSPRSAQLYSATMGSPHALSKNRTTGTQPEYHVVAESR